MVHGNSYTKKFADKSGGFVIMRYRLKRWWRIPALWPICFSILFGQDVAQIDLNKPFDQFSFSDLSYAAGELNVFFPEVLPVITGMLQSALKATVLEGNASSDLATDYQGDNQSLQLQSQPQG